MVFDPASDSHMIALRYDRRFPHLLSLGLCRDTRSPLDLVPVYHLLLVLLQALFDLSYLRACELDYLLDLLSALLLFLYLGLDPISQAHRLIGHIVLNLRRWWLNYLDLLNRSESDVFVSNFDDLPVRVISVGRRLLIRHRWIRWLFYLLDPNNWRLFWSGQLLFALIEVQIVNLVC